MNSERIKIISLSLEHETHALIKDAASKLGHKNVSQTIRDLVKKYLSLLVSESEDIPVVIRIPKTLRKDPENLRLWLETKTRAIVKALS